MNFNEYVAICDTNMSLSSSKETCTGAGYNWKSGLIVCYYTVVSLTHEKGVKFHVVKSDHNHNAHHTSDAVAQSICY